MMKRTILTRRTAAAYYGRRRSVLKSSLMMDKGAPIHAAHVHAAVHVQHQLPATATATTTTRTRTHTMSGNIQCWGKRHQQHQQHRRHQQHRNFGTNNRKKKPKGAKALLSTKDNNSSNTNNNNNNNNSNNREHKYTSGNNNMNKNNNNGSRNQAEDFTVSNQSQQESATTTKTVVHTPSSSQIPSPQVPSKSLSQAPSSLIRTDFALQSSATTRSRGEGGEGRNRQEGGEGRNRQELILPSGYEIPLTTTPATASLSSNGETNASEGASSNPTSSFEYINYKELYNPDIHLPSAPQDWSKYEHSTPLWEEIAAKIGVLGRPITIAEYISSALLHPKYGYYSQPNRITGTGENVAANNNNNNNDDDDDDDDLFKDEDDDDDLFNDDDVSNKDNDNNDNPIFGPRGDFVTAPEICQVFGESIQVWMITQWEAMGKPKSYQMVEFGPGRGTLMADMIKFVLSTTMSTSSTAATTTTTTTANANASPKLNEYGTALRVIHLIEPSHPLRQQQEKTLREELNGMVEWIFHNPAAASTSNSVELEENNSTTTTTTTTATTMTSNKPIIHVYWHDTFASLSAMIMRQKQRNIGHEPTTKLNKEEEDDDIANMPLFVICQEFFDALPVHAFEMTKEGWRERMVDMAIRDEILEEGMAENAVLDDNDGNISQSAPSSEEFNSLDKEKRPRLRIVLAPEVTPALKTLLRVDEEGMILDDNPDGGKSHAEVGQVVEVCPEGILLVQDIASLLEHQGGAALIIDYGEEGSADSLRGFWKHKQRHFLSLPGQTDVTADVDFTALRHAVNLGRPTNSFEQMNDNSSDDASNALQVDNDNKELQKEPVKAFGPIPQGKFLVSMGARERVIQCIESDSTSDEEAEDLFHALERLVAAEQMGMRYKVLAIAPERTKKEIKGSYRVPPAGF